MAPVLWHEKVFSSFVRGEFPATIRFASEHLTDKTGHENQAIGLLAAILSAYFLGIDFNDRPAIIRRSISELLPDITSGSNHGAILLATEGFLHHTEKKSLGRNLIDKASYISWNPASTACIELCRSLYETHTGGNIDHALKLVEESIRSFNGPSLDPVFRYYYLWGRTHRAHLLNLLLRYDDSLDQSRTDLDLNGGWNYIPLYESIYLNFADAYAGLLDKKSALTNLNRAIDLWDTHLVHSRKNYVLTICAIKALEMNADKEALEILEKRKKEGRPNPVQWNMIRTALIRKGIRDEARAWRWPPGHEGNR